MSEQTSAFDASRYQLPCDIAQGKAEADPTSAAISIRAAHKDLNAKGRGPCWYRMVWRGNTWQYFSDGRLPTGTFRAAERRATVYGDVFVGEIIAQHDKGGPIEAVYLIAPGPSDSEIKLSPALDFTKRRDGMLAVTLPDGSGIVLPNPRK